MGQMPSRTSLEEARVAAPTQASSGSGQCLCGGPGLCLGEAGSWVGKASGAGKDRASAAPATAG